MKHRRIVGYKAIVAAPFSSIVICLLDAESRQFVEEVVRFAQTDDAGLAFSETGLRDRFSSVPKESSQIKLDFPFADMRRNGHDPHSFLSEKEWDPLPLMDGSSGGN